MGEHQNLLLERISLKHFVNFHVVNAILKYYALYQR